MKLHRVTSNRVDLQIYCTHKRVTKYIDIVIYLEKKKKFIVCPFLKENEKKVRRGQREIDVIFDV